MLPDATPGFDAIVWVPACATGEEAYSLAMLVDELLPRHGTDSGRNWKIVILGTDIDEDGLQQAGPVAEVAVGEEGRGRAVAEPFQQAQAEQRLADAGFAGEQHQAFAVGETLEKPGEGAFDLAGILAI